MAIVVVVVTAAGRKFNTFWSALWLAVMTTAAVQIALLPLLPPDNRPNLVIAVVANTAIAPFITLAFVLGLIAIIVSPVVPPVGEALAIIAGQANRVSLWIIESLAAWKSPLPVEIGFQAPEWLVIMIAFATLAIVSKEFRRFARTSWAALNSSRSYMAPLTLGLGLGLLVGMLAVTVLI